MIQESTSVNDSSKEQIIEAIESVKENEVRISKPKEKELEEQINKEGT